jgi:UDP-2,3-diacylglucosamine hydrolase
MDVNDAAVAQAMRAHALTRLVHGHTHRPGRHALTIDGRPTERWVLPDWYGRGGYLEIGRGAPKLVRF